MVHRRDVGRRRLHGAAYADDLTGTVPEPVDVDGEGWTIFERAPES